jgi:hypothetical protein
MKVYTSNPIIIDKEKVSPRDYYSNASADVSVDMKYLPEEAVSADDLKVLTKYPVILNGSDISPRDYYSNTTGPVLTPETLASLQTMSAQTGKEPTAAQKDAAKQQGLFWDNLKKGWQSFSNSDTGKQLLGQIDSTLTARRESKYGTTPSGGYAPSEQAAPKPETLSTTAKVLLIGGGVLVAGLLIYSIVAKGK